jgi:hypothetical protein
MYAASPRFVEDLIMRLTGPLHLRFLIQTAMASNFGIRDGYEDAHQGKPPYVWDMFTSPAHRKDFLLGGLKSVSKILILDVILDVVYQITILRCFLLDEDLLVALGLAFVPYILIRSPENRIATWRAYRRASSQPGHGTPP